MKAYMLLPQKRCTCASFFGIDINVYSNVYSITRVTEMENRRLVINQIVDVIFGFVVSYVGSKHNIVYLTNLADHVSK